MLPGFGNDTAFFVKSRASHIPRSPQYGLLLPWFWMGLLMSMALAHLVLSQPGLSVGLLGFLSVPLIVSFPVLLVVSPYSPTVPLIGSLHVHLLSLLVALVVSLPVPLVSSPVCLSVPPGVSPLAPPLLSLVVPVLVHLLEPDRL